MAFGEDVLPALDEQLKDNGIETMPQAVRIHLFGHRFAKSPGADITVEDWMTYHTNLLVEWDHGKFCSIIELGCLHVVGSARGKSIWYPKEDKALASAIPDCMIAPWLPHLAEMRCSDVPARNLAEFQAYMDEHTGPGKYFLEPSFQYSGPVRLTWRSQADIMRYLLNYMGRDRRYNKFARNCQYFAADFFSFMAGKSGIQPFCQVMRPGYVVRSHLFLYDPAMYKNPDATENEPQAPGSPGGCAKTAPTKGSSGGYP